MFVVLLCYALCWKVPRPVQVWNSSQHLTGLLRVAAGVHPSSFTFEVAVEKTRRRLWWRPWRSFKERMMTCNDLQNFTKKLWRIELLVVSTCVWQKRRVCVWSFVRSKDWCAFLTTFFSHKNNREVLFRMIKSVSKETGRKLLSQHSAF